VRAAANNLVDAKFGASEADLSLALSLHKRQISLQWNIIIRKSCINQTTTSYDNMLYDGIIQCEMMT